MAQWVKWLANKLATGFNSHIVETADLHTHDTAHTGKQIQSTKFLNRSV